VLIKTSSLLLGILLGLHDTQNNAWTKLSYSYRESKVEVEAFDRMLPGVPEGALEHRDGRGLGHVGGFGVHEVGLLAALAVLLGVNVV